MDNLDEFAYSYCKPNNKNIHTMDNIEELKKIESQIFNMLITFQEKLKDVKQTKIVVMNLTKISTEVRSMIIDSVVGDSVTG